MTVGVTFERITGPRPGGVWGLVLRAPGLALELRLTRDLWTGGPELQDALIHVLEDPPPVELGGEGDVDYGGCEAIGVGGMHSEHFGEADGRCEWCGLVRRSSVERRVERGGVVDSCELVGGYCRIEGVRRSIEPMFDRLGRIRGPGWEQPEALWAAPRGGWARSPALGAVPSFRLCGRQSPLGAARFGSRGSHEGLGLHGR